MRTRARLLLTFLGAHLVLTLAMGAVAWLWLDASMRAQAQDSARSLARVISQGGFPLTPEVMDKMRALTGYRFGVLPARTMLRPGTVQVEVEGRVVEVDYLTQTYLGASTAVLVGTLAVTIAGTLGFGLLSFWLSAQFATPLERLARAARTIGSGDLEATVAVVGSGEVRELAVELEHMRARLIDLDRQHRSAERLAAIGTFTATIAHEVRNPLSAVRLIVQMLAMRTGPEGQDPSLRLVMDELERLDLIVDELLAYSKGMSVQPVACDLDAVAETVVRLLRRQAEHAGVELSISGKARVQADPARLRQLLMNLVLNAIQAQHAQGDQIGAAAGAQRPGAVRVVIASDGFSVSDDGPGVDPALVPQLFEPFSSNRPRGAGLGLHLARAISDAHGGRLTYQTQARGACFTLSGLNPASDPPTATAGDQKGG
jgi:signal transduction histidine kinase